MISRNGYGCEEEQMHVSASEGLTFGDLFDRACHKQLLERKNRPVVRFVCHAARLEPPHIDFDKVVTGEYEWIRIEVIPNDQRNMDEASERLCEIQLMELRDGQLEPQLQGQFFFKLNAREKLLQFRQRFEKKFRISGQQVQVIFELRELEPADVPWDIVDEFGIIVVVMSPPDPITKPLAIKSKRA
jgi:hypothetical protein